MSCAAVLLAGAGLASLSSLSSCAKATPATCALNSDCERGSYCGSDGLCTQDCVDATRDCPKGYFCSDLGKCEYEGDAGGAGPSSASASSSSSSPTTASTSDATASGSTGDTTSTAATSSTSSGMGTLGELDICAAEGDCGGTLHCRQMTKGSSKRCTRVCAADADCAAGFRCDDPGDGTPVCLESDVGRACADATACNDACLVGPGTCTNECTSGSDCPNGWGCMEVAGQHVCVKAEAACDSTDASACVVSAACDTSTSQLLVSSCTLACSTAADCPRRAAGLNAWTCDGLCRRPADVYGPLEGGYDPAQYACNATSQVVNLCNDAQHIDFDQFIVPAAPSVNCSSPTATLGAAGDACVDSCRYQGSCAYGFGCTAVGQIAGARIGLCLPEGFGEVGAACTRDRDCVFGYCHTNTCSRDCTHDGLCPTGSACVAAGGPAVEGEAFARCE